MEMHQLRYFVAVARTGTFSRFERPPQNSAAGASP